MLTKIYHGTAKLNVSMMVQVPASFDKTNPCIVIGTSSGSRGVYGAVATARRVGPQARLRAFSGTTVSVPDQRERQRQLQLRARTRGCPIRAVFACLRAARSVRLRR